MYDVVSLGSVNVDRVGRLTSDALDRLADGWPPFPEAGETKRVESVPPEFETQVDDTNVGGKGANQAVAAARAEAGTAFLGAVGADQAEYDVLDTLASYGVDVSRVAETDDRTGTAYVFVDETGENRIAILAGANGAVTPAYADAQADTLAGAGAVCLQNEIPVETADRALSRLDDLPTAERPTVVFNPAPAPGAGPLLDHPSLSVVVVNESEAETLADGLAGIDATVVTTLGGEAVVVEGPDEAFRLTPPTVDPADTTGAGDTFVGYLAAGLADGDPLRPAVERATVAGSLSTEAEGVHAAMPARERVERALADWRTR